MEIQLGDKVKCIYTGFTGIAVAKTEFINGCVQFSIAPKWDGKAPLIDEMGIDSQSLKVIKKRKEEDEDEDYEESGGPMRRAIKQRGY